MAESAPVAAARGAPDAGSTAGDAAPRKRRRRAPTTGAAVDCFACQEAHTTCDRRRPYCSQCIDRGKTCSGYKTQLTWGVGVASRGKLRGLSLPVASKAPSASNEANKPAPSKVISPSIPTSFSDSFPFHQEPHPSPGFASTFAPNPSIYQFGTSPKCEDSSAPSPSQHQFTWRVPTNPPPQPPVRPPFPKKAPRRHSIQPIQMPPPPPVSAMLSPMPMSAGVYGGYSYGSLDSAVADPVAIPFPQYPDGTIGDKRNSAQASWSSSGHLDGYRSAFSTGSWRSDTMSSDFSSNRSSRAFSEEEIFTPDTVAIDSQDSFTTERGQPSRISHSFHYPELNISEEPEDDIEGVVGHNMDDLNSPILSLTAPGSLSGPLVGRTPQLRELIRYYDQVIAPVILAFNGPTNPYRTHILRLANSSDALQHAIAALAASNLRMRKESEPVAHSTQKYLTDGINDTKHDESVRKSSLAHNILRNQVDRPEHIAQPGSRAQQRELYHKGQSIKALNNELARLRSDPSTSDETVLATLFLLCLYHTCDTGVAKFRTQFAGVKKILALRNRRQRSSDANWIITMFRWFDAMTATVNDREGQFDEDWDDEGLEEWALENLAGCDSRLFKIMSKLGRINMLSQGRTVNEGSSTPRAQPPQPFPHGFSPVDAYPGSLDFASTEDLSAYSPLDNKDSQFAVEWYAVQQELLNWQFDPTTIPAAMRASATTMPDFDPEIIDLRNISESMRYSSLLYLERVAHPLQSSSAPNFQVLVEQAIDHIRLVVSDAYLLWPLFITGSECVAEEHRNLIRRRCRSIQSDSGFYNNSSTLGLLERTWHERDENDVNALAQDFKIQGPFKWRKNMQVGDEEYIVL